MKNALESFTILKLQERRLSMICETIKAGTECTFMSKKGCTFNSGSCHTIIEKCEGCNKIIEHDTGKFCMVYPDPAGKWAIGGCPSASHIKLTKAEEAQKINPLKASKRASKKGSKK